MKTKHILRSNRGMTLVEVLITLLVILILIPSISICLFSVMRQYAWAKSYADLCSVVSVIDGTVERELSTADGFQTNDGGTFIRYAKGGTRTRQLETLAADNGQNILYIGGDPVFDIAFYNGISVTATFQIERVADEDDERDDPIRGVRVTLTYTGESTYVSTFIVEKIIT